MMHKAWCSIEEVPYCFPRSSIEFQGHTGWKIDDLDQIWAITRPVAAIKSLRFALLHFTPLHQNPKANTTNQYPCFHSINTQQY